MAEPWANSQCTDMLRYVLEGGFKVTVFTTLYRITEEDANIIIDILRRNSDRVELICIHFPDSNGNMRGWRPSREWEAVFIKFCSLRDENIIQRFDFMTMDGSGRIHKSLDHLNIKLGSWTGNTRAGSLNDCEMEREDFCKQTPRHDSAVACKITPFYDHNVVLPNGDAVLCCMDYGLKHVIGNILTGEYEDHFEANK